jgi:hypothetical protein
VFWIKCCVKGSYSCAPIRLAEFGRTLAGMVRHGRKPRLSSRRNSHHLTGLRWSGSRSHMASLLPFFALLLTLIELDLV